MLPSERLDSIKKILSENKFLHIKELERQFQISRSTATRDLEDLIQLGLAKRTRGGVIRVKNSSKPFECPVFSSNKNTAQLSEKIKIVSMAANLLAPPATLFIDGGSTTLQLCPFIINGNFRVITNSLGIACYLLENSALEVILAGGLLHHRARITIGPHAMEVVKSVHADWFIASVGGVDEKGLTNTDLLTVEIERQMMQQSARTMLLIDHTKFNRKALTFLTDFRSVDVIVTDEKPNENIQQALKQAKVELVIAN